MSETAHDEDDFQTVLNVHEGTGPGTKDPEKDLPPSDYVEPSPPVEAPDLNTPSANEPPVPGAEQTQEEEKPSE